MLAGQRILIVNDDGIHAPGIQLLEKIVRRFTDDVWVIAPDEERSGASNSVSLHVPVRVRQLDAQRFAVKGTPTDCVIMAMRELMADNRPTLVLSGINRGANLAEDSLYSGTIAAAMEATLFGVPAIALSQVAHRGAPVPWDTAEHYTPAVVESILATGIPERTIVNINFPPVSADAVAGVQAVAQGTYPLGTFSTEARVDGRDVPYYWIRLSREKSDYVAGTDLHAVSNGHIAVAPLHADLTAHALVTPLATAFSKLALPGRSS